MGNILVNQLLAFIEGLGLIASPCILPILPIILSGSIEGSKKRPLGIICGFILTFAVFTFFSRKLVSLFGINSEVVRDIAVVLLVFIAFTMMSSTLTEQFSRLTRSLANVGSSESSINNPQSGFWSGLFFGGLVALIWTPCAGPILAAVIVQTVIQKTTLNSFLILMSFALGAGIPMILIALFGRAIMSKMGFLKAHSGLLRKVLGVIILASIGLMFYNGNTVSSTFATSNNGKDMVQTALINGLPKPYPAPAIDGIAAWMNSPPLKMSDLKGKVVLVDFWTYSCINCIRTLPYVIDWFNKYRNDGLVIIGVHTPEFDFEKSVTNVRSAVEKDGIHYPVALDSNYVTWQNFNNQYWPAQYLINQNGEVVYQHFGEGEDDVMENNIRFLLSLNKITAATASSENLADLISHQTPETYLGYKRAASYASPESIAENATAVYSFPAELHENGWALQGKWTVTAENIISAGSGSAIKINLHAKKVYIVMGADNNTAMPVKILFNGENVVANKGKDVKDSMVQVSSHALYEILSFDHAESGILEIIAPHDGLEIYTFTFGNK
jgi:cytochrome c biogenesis protein CcdA/thiol-disulfide isomerase/thioredoxin